MAARSGSCNPPRKNIQPQIRGKQMSGRRDPSITGTVMGIEAESHAEASRIMLAHPDMVTAAVKGKTGWVALVPGDGAKHPRCCLWVGPGKPERERRPSLPIPGWAMRKSLGISPIYGRHT